MNKYLTIWLLLLSANLLHAAKLTLIAPNNGTFYALDSKGHRYEPSAAAYEVGEGEKLVFYATPDNDCYWFSSWNPLGGKMTNDTLWMPNNDVEVRALFVVYQYTITADVFPLETGSVRLEIGLGDIYLHVSGPVNCGMQVRMTALSNNSSGYYFSHWSDGYPDPVRTIDVDGDANYTAIFTNGQDPTDINNLQSAVNKDGTYIHNGQLLIYRLGEWYNAQGIKIY